MGTSGDLRPKVLKRRALGNLIPDHAHLHQPHHRLPAQIVENALGHHYRVGQFHLDAAECERRVAQAVELLADNLARQWLLPRQFQRAGPLGGRFASLFIAKNDTQRFANTA